MLVQSHHHRFAGISVYCYESIDEGEKGRDSDHKDERDVVLVKCVMNNSRIFYRKVAKCVR